MRRDFDQRSIIVNGVKRMADLFGYSKDLITLSLSLSLSLSCANRQFFYINNRAGTRVNIRFSLLSGKGDRIVFCPLTMDG